MFKKEDGFTLIEIIAVLIVMGILAAVAVSRSLNYDVEVRSGADTLKMHLRYAQTLAMNSNTNVWGISKGGSSYWLFQGTNTSNYWYIPEDGIYLSGKTVNLTAKKIQLADFTVYFDNRGIPYSAYTNTTNNAPLTSNSTITVSPLSGGTNVAVTITPLTGYIP
jgi:prepilin-type N-terminal cleavage/methylation domain-containing protein